MRSALQVASAIDFNRAALKTKVSVEGLRQFMSVYRLTKLSVVARAAVPLNCLILIPGNLGNGTLGQMPATRLQIKFFPSHY